MADHVVDAGPAGLRLDAIEELAERSSGTVIGLAPTTVFANYELDPYVATAVTPGRLGDVLDLGIVEGSVAEPNAGEVMLSEDAAASMGAGVGDRVDIRLGDGTAAAPTVVAVYERSLGFGDVVLPWQLVDGHLTDAMSRSCSSTTVATQVRPDRHWLDSRPITPAPTSVVARSCRPPRTPTPRHRRGSVTCCSVW